MHHTNSAVNIVVATIGVLSAQLHLGLADAGGACSTGGQLVYNNSVYDPATVSGPFPSTDFAVAGTFCCFGKPTSRQRKLGTCGSGVTL